MRRLEAFILIILYAEIVLGAVSVNEIHYNPDGSDNNQEYVEIYSDDFLNMSGYMIQDSKSSDTLIGVKYVNNSFSLIVEDGFDYSSINASIYTVGATIGNNLNNDEDLFVLKDNDSNILDAISYSDSWGGDDNNLSLCKISDAEGLWQECSLTPGASNNAAVNNNCDWSLLVILNGTVFEDPEFKIKAVKIDGDSKANMTVDKWVVDSYGNIDKTYAAWNIENSLNYKTSSKYSPALEKGDAYFINANITNISCVDTDLSNNYVSEMIFVTEEGGLTATESVISILDISPDEVEFGDIVKVKVNVYRGMTSKYAVYAYIEDSGTTVSEKSTIHVKDKYTNYTFTIPVQLKTNCNEKYEDGKYDLIVEGLDLSVEDSIKIEGITSSLCNGRPILSSSSSSTSPTKKFEYELVSTSNEVFSGEKVNTQVKLTNNDDENYDIDIWSYIYRGNKAYSGGREDNKESLKLEEGSSEIVSLSNDFLEGSPGDYNLKIKIRKNKQKTTKDITEKVKMIKEVEEESLVELDDEKFLDEENYKSNLLKWSESLVYKSTSFKAKEIMPSLFIFGLSLLVVVLLLTKSF